MLEAYSIQASLFFEEKWMKNDLANNHTTHSWVIIGMFDW